MLPTKIAGSGWEKLFFGRKSCHIGVMFFWDGNFCPSASRLPIKVTAGCCSNGSSSPCNGRVFG